MTQSMSMKPHKDREAGTTNDAAPKKDKPAHVPKVTYSTGPKDPLAIQTIVISGLPAAIDSKSLWKKVRKYDGAEKVEWPAKVNDRDDSSIGTIFSPCSSAVPTDR